jgi:thioredoxin 2
MSESLHLVCPNCQAVNRVPTIRLSQHPNCGKCHQPIFNGTPFEFTAATFQNHIKNNDVPILVDFWAPWCGPCKSMAPAFAQAAVVLEPKIRLCKVNTDVEQVLGNQYGIHSIPILILFYAGKEVARQSGAMGLQDIVRWVNAHL